MDTLSSLTLGFHDLLSVDIQLADTGREGVGDYPRDFSFDDPGPKVIISLLPIFCGHT